MRLVCLALFTCALTLSVPALASAQPRTETYDLRAHFRDADSYAHAATQLYVTSVLLLAPSALGAVWGSVGVSLSSSFRSLDDPSWLIVAAAITTFVGHVLTMALAITYDAASSARRRDAMDHLPSAPSLAILPSISPDGAGLSARIVF